MKKIISIICTIMLALTLTFAFTGCNKTEYSYWEIKAKSAGDSRLTFVSEILIGTSSEKVGEVWVNIADIPSSGATITLKFYNSSSLKKTLSYVVSSEILKKSKDGWLNAYYDTAIECTKVEVSVIESMKFNEIVFVKEDGKLVTPIFTQGGVKSSVSDKSANIYGRDALDKLSPSDPAYSEHPSYNIVDEQDKFPLEYIKTKG